MPPQPRMFIRTTFQPWLPGPAAGSDHVARVAGALQSVHDQQRQPLLPLRLPVAMAQHPHARLNLEEPLLGLGQAVRPPQKVSGNRLRVAAAQKTARHKVIGTTRARTVAAER